MIKVDYEKLGLKSHYNIAAYCRVSTSSKDQENSYENQKLYFEEEIKYHKEEGWELQEIYADKGITGTKMNRPRFNQLLTDCGLDPKTFEIKRKSKIDLILVKNTSRFGRNLGGVDTVLKQLAQNNTYVYYLDLNKATYNQEDITYIQIYGTFDERESVDKSKKVRFGIEMSKKHNRLRTTPRLYGYSYNQESKKLMQNEESPNVKLIFDLFEQGYGIRRTINELEKRGIKNREGKTFAKTSIRRILDNEKYAGLNNPMKWESGTIFKDKHPPRVRPGYEVMPNENIEAIISPKQFYKCKEIMEKKVAEAKGAAVKGYKVGTSKYGAQITCSCCGAKLRSNIDNGKRFYVCGTKKSKGIAYCNMRNITEAKLDELVNEEIEVWTDIQKTYINKYLHLCLQYIRNDCIQKISGSDKEEIETLQKEVSEIKTQIENIIKFISMLSDGNMAEFAVKVNDLQQKKVEKETRLKALTNTKYYQDRIEWIDAIFEEEADTATTGYAAEYRILTAKEILNMSSSITYYIDEFDDPKLKFEYKNLFMYKELDEVKGMFGEYPCCDVFTRINSKESIIQFFRKHPRISLEDMDIINNEMQLKREQETKEKLKSNME